VEPDPSQGGETPEKTGEKSVRVVLQRVSQGSVRVNGETIAEIGHGLVVLTGIGPEDGVPQAQYLAEKIANLRIFADEEGKTNLSLLDVKGEAIVVSQFTLYADTRKGRRPSFVKAAPPELAKPLVEKFAEMLRQQGVPTQSGEFGAEMLVQINNDGPVTILIERD
jgi:D-tyrosyl-tRNA(Tyr) deacylase